MGRISRRTFLKSAGVVGGAAAVAGFPYVNRLALGQSKPFKWGYISPFTGPYATETHDQRRGVEIAVEEINEKGGILGRKVELVVRDTEFNPAAARRKAVELLEQEKVDLIAGTLSGPEELVMNELACKYNILFANYPQNVVSHKKGLVCKWFIGSHLTPFQSAAAMGRYAAQHLGKKWHYIGDNYSWPQLLLRGLEKMAKETGATLAPPTWAPFPATDYSQFIPKVQAAKPEVLFVGNFGSPQVTFAKQAVEFGLKQQMKIVVLNTEITMAEAAGRGVFDGFHAGTVWYWTLKDKYPGAKAFFDKFHARTQRVPSGYASVSYTTTRLIADTANEIKSADLAKLTAALEGRKFQYVKGPEQIRACDHSNIQQAFVLRGKPAEAMKDKWDFFDVIGEVGAEAIEPCKDEGFDEAVPLSKT